MNLYHWNLVTVLKNYACGDIIVYAVNEQEARDKVRSAFMGWLKVERDGLFHPWQDGQSRQDDLDEIAKLVATLEKDLEAAPLIKDVVFITGSE